MRADKIEERKVHSEWSDASVKTIVAIEAAKVCGNKVQVVGTTSIHALESATCETGRLEADYGDIDVFITPGYRFNAVGRLIINSHLPRSTLLMLVSASSDMGHIRSVYCYAVEQEYRFFSYDGAMILGKAE